MLKKSISFFFVALAIFFTTALHAEESISLGYRFKNGQTRTMTTLTTQEMTLVIPVIGEQTMVSTNETTFKLDTLSVDADGSALIKMTFQSFDIEGEAGDFSYSYDSNSDEASDSILYEILHPLIGKSFEMVITREGATREIKGLMELFDSLYDLYDLDEGELLEYRSLLNSLLSEEVLKDSFAHIVPVHPKNPVNVGDTWSIETEKQLPKGTLHNTFFFEDIDDGLAYIQHEVTMKCAPLTLTPGDIVTTMTMDFSGNGHVVMDIDSGWVLKHELIQEFEGSQSISPCEDIPEGLSWPFYGRTSILSTIE